MIEEIKIKQPNEIIIEMLKNMVARAEKGEIQSIAIAGVNDDCNPFNVFCGDFYPTSLIGELRLLERDLVDLCCEIRKEVSWDFCNV